MESKKSCLNLQSINENMSLIFSKPGVIKSPCLYTKIHWPENSYNSILIIGNIEFDEIMRLSNSILMKVFWRLNSNCLRLSTILYQIQS